MGRGRFDYDLRSLPREQFADARRPLDHHHAALLEQLGEADRLEVFAAGDAVGVEVEDFQTSGVVDVEQDEGGTADGAGIAAQAGEQAADELRLTRAELAGNG